MNIYTTLGGRVFSDRLAQDLDTWLLEVRHYPEEQEVISKAIDILKSYGNSPLDRRGTTDNDT